MLERIILALSLCVGGLTAAEGHKKEADPKPKTEHAKPAEKPADKPKADARDAETDLAKAYFAAQDEFGAALHEALKSDKRSFNKEEAATDPNATRTAAAAKKARDAQRAAILDFFQDERRRAMINPATTDDEKNLNGYVARYPWDNDVSTGQKAARFYAKVHGVTWLAELVDGKR